MMRSVAVLPAFVCVALVVAVVLRLPPWYALPGGLALWAAALAAGRLLHGAWIGSRLRREGPRGETARVVDTAARLLAVAEGCDGFTGTPALRGLERAVLLGATPQPESAALASLRSATSADLARISEGYHAAGRAASEAFSSPSHALYPDASRVLKLLGMRPSPLPLGIGVAREWKAREALLDPAAPRTALALRLLERDMPRAALAVVGAPPASAGHEGRVARLARFRVLQQQAAGSSLVALPVAELDDWAEELVLLAGRQLPELVPGSRLLAAVTGGAASLERAVGATGAVVADLVQLHAEAPPLRRSVEHVLAKISGRSVTRVRAELARGALVVPPDGALRGHLRGLALLDEGRPREAAGEFEACLAQAPDFCQAAYALAVVQRDLGDERDGESVLRALVGRRGRDPAAALFLARFLADGDDPSRARAAFAAALERFPRFVPLRVAYAEALSGWGRSEGAAEQLDRARRQNPDDPRLALLAGRALVEDGQYERAQAALGDAARDLRGPERAEARFWLMAALRDSGDHARAVRLADALVGQLGRGQAMLLESVAEYLEERHEYDRAREASERVRRLREL